MKTRYLTARLVCSYWIVILDHQLSAALCHCVQMWAVCIVRSAAVYHRVQSYSMHRGQYTIVCTELQYALWALCIVGTAAVCRSVQYALCAPAKTLLRQFKNCFCE